MSNIDDICEAGIESTFYDSSNSWIFISFSYVENTHKIISKFDERLKKKVNEN